MMKGNQRRDGVEREMIECSRRESVYLLLFLDHIIRFILFWVGRRGGGGGSCKGKVYLYTKMKKKNTKKKNK
jgi:hypothetical protein